MMKKQRSYNQDIANAVRWHLEEHDLYFSFDEDSGIITLVMDAGGKTVKRLNYVIYIDDNKFITYAHYPIGPSVEDDEVMREISYFLHQANRGLPGGNFEFNCLDGEIKYTYKCPCFELHAPTDKMIATSMWDPIAAFRLYEQGLIDVLFKGIPAEKALVRCESNARLKELVDGLEALVRAFSDEEDCGDDLEEKSHISFSEDFLKFMAERPVEEDDCCEAE